MTDIKKTVISIIMKTCQPNTPTLDDHDRPLLESGLDSLDYATTLMELEDSFSVKISNEDMDSLHTINEIVGFIKSEQS